MPTASTSTLGGVKVDGTSITINGGVISASGGLSISNGVDVYDEDILVGTFNALNFVGGSVVAATQSTSNGGIASVTISGGTGTGSSYVLPTASTSTLGGVKIGSGINISNGVISVTSSSSSSYVLTTATYNTLGGVKIGSTSFKASSDGTIDIANTLTNIDLSGTITVGARMSNVVLNITSATGYIDSTGTRVIQHDSRWGTTWYHTGLTASFTPNFTNDWWGDGRAYTSDRLTTLTIIIAQGTTPYNISNNVKINAVTVSTKWLGGIAPVATANKTEFYTYQLLRTISTTTPWIVTGKMESYG